MTRQPSPNGSVGQRDASGRFARGNAGGPGNPYAKQVGALRSAMIGAVTPDDLAAVMAKLVTLAKAGSVPAIREVLDRTLGKPVQADLIERIEELERLVAAKAEAPA